MYMSSIEGLEQLTADQMQALQSMGVKADASGQLISPKTGQPYTADRIALLLASGGQPVKAISGQVATVAPAPVSAPAPAPAPAPSVMPVAEGGGTSGWVLPVAIGGGVLVAGGVAAVLMLRRRKR